MKFLILINSAPDYQPFFLALGNELIKQGHEVVYAIESRLGNAEYPDHKVPETPYVFSEYLHSRSGTSELPLQYQHLNIWESFFSDFDRFEHFKINLKKRHDWYSNVVVSLFTFFDSLVKEEDIDLVLYENISNSFSYAAYLVAKEHAVPYLGWTSCRITGRYETHTSISSQSDSIAQTYQDIKTGTLTLDEATLAWCENYLQTFMEVVPDYMQQNSLKLQNPISKYTRVTKLKKVAHRVDFVLSSPRWAHPYHLGNPLIFSFKQFLRNFNRYLKSKLIEHHFTHPAEGEQYFFYPIHFHPESSTSVHARHYVDELVVIKNIAFNLPFGYLLYVKDHKSAVGYPTLDFYNAVASLPNVRLISPNAPTKKLILESTAVITLTSTVGYEAIVLRQQVVVLGNVFYDFHPLCRKMSRWNTLFSMLTESTKNKPDGNHVDSIDFIASYYLNTHPGKLIIGGKSDSGILSKIVDQAIFEGNKLAKRK
jgi:hypothetical protein